MTVMLVKLLILQSCYLPPVAAPITDPYLAPACSYCPGHRGVEYTVPQGTPVRATASGVVTFSGIVVATRYVVVAHADLVTATYGLLSTSAVAVGDVVGAGDMVATTTRRLYFGLRDAQKEPLDPLAYLAVVERRPRLVPTDGSPSRAAVVRAPRCPKGAGTTASAR